MENYRKRDQLLSEGLRAARAGNRNKAQIKVLRAADFGYVPSNHPTLQKINEALSRSNPAGWIPAKAVKITRNGRGQATAIKIQT